MLLLNLSPSFSLALPQTVILIRHAEKPKKQADHLSSKGRQRALVLHKMFEKGGSLRKWGIPNVFVAAQYIAGETSKRSIETLQPFADQVGSDIVQNFPREEVKRIANWILNDPRTNGAVVLVAWPHSELDKIARRLGIETEEWSDDVFNRAWVIEYDAAGNPRFYDMPQKLLPGD